MRQLLIQEIQHYQRAKRSTSPRTHSPKSPKTYDLDVCGKIERAKDLVQIGIEAKIEHLENKSVPKSESLSDPCWSWRRWWWLLNNWNHLWYNRLILNMPLNHITLMCSKCQQMHWI
jgi:hypothetical protein